MKGFVYLLEIAIVAILMTVVIGMLFAVRIKQNWEKSDLISTGYNMLNNIKQDNKSLINILNENMTEIDALGTKNINYNLQVIGVPKSNINVGCSGSPYNCWQVKNNLLTPTYVNNRWINFTVSDLDLNAPEFSDYDAIVLYGLDNYTKQKDKINNYLENGGVLLGINDTTGDKVSQEVKDFYEIFNISDPWTFKDGFESSGEFGQWDSAILHLNSNLEVTNKFSAYGSNSSNFTIDVPYAINKTKRFDGGHASLTKKFSDTQTIYTSFYFYLNNTTGLNNWNNQSFPILIATHIADNTTRSRYINSVFLLKGLDNKTVYIGMRNYRGYNERYTFNFTTQSIAPNKWYFIKFKTIIGCPTGESQLWVGDNENDEVLVFSWTGLCNDDTGLVNKTRIGLDASPGDIIGDGANGNIRDGICDLGDFQVLGSAYNGKEGDSKYRAEVDIRGDQPGNEFIPDGIINLGDLHIVTLFFNSPVLDTNAGPDNIQAFFDEVTIETNPTLPPVQPGGPFREYETIPKYFLGLGFDVKYPSNWVIWEQQWNVNHFDATHVNITKVASTESYFVAEGGNFSITSPLNGLTYTFKVRKIFYHNVVYIQPLNTTFPFIDFSEPSICVKGQHNVINKSDGCALMTSNNTAIWMSDFPESDEHRTLVKAALASRVSNWYAEKHVITGDTVTVSSFIPLCCDMPETAELYLTLWYQL